MHHLIVALNEQQKLFFEKCNLILKFKENILIQIIHNQ